MHFLKVVSILVSHLQFFFVGWQSPMVGDSSLSIGLICESWYP